MNTSIRPLFVASSALVLTPWALAQNAAPTVQLFGSVAVSIVHKVGNSSTSMIAGPWTAPTFGMQGAEDMGGGWKTSFRLEQGIDASDGTRGPTDVAKAKFFDKAAWLAIGNDAMTLSMGRQTNAAIDRMATTLDLFQASADGREILSSLALNGSNTFAKFDTRVDKSIKLRYRGSSGFSGGISFGGKVADTTTGNSFAVDVGLNTSQYGVGGYYMEYKGDGARAGFRQRTWGVGGNYNFGPLRGYLHYMDAQHDKLAQGVAQQSDEVWGVGLSAPLSAAFTLKAAYYQDSSDSVGGQNQSGKRTTTVLMGDYALSKRTVLHAGIYRNGVSGAFRTDGFSQVVNGLIGIPAGTSGATNLAFGLSHRF